MSLTIEDLKPKNFKITIKGVELDCKPLRLSDALVISKLGDIFQNAKTASREDIEQSEKDMDAVIAKLIPDLTGVELDISSILEVLSQLMDHVEPADNKELKEKGVSFDNDPKAERTGS